MSSRKSLIKSLNVLGLLLIPLAAFTNCAPLSPAGVASLSSTESGASSGGDGGGFTEPSLPAPGPVITVPQGKTLIQSSSECLESGSGAVLAATCDAANKNQLFTVLPHSDGSVTLKDLSKNECVGLVAEALTSSSDLKSAACSNLADQNFSPLYAASGFYRLVSQINGSCLTLSSGKKIGLAVCNNSSAQSFKLSPETVSAYKFSAAIEKPLAVTPGKALSKTYKGMHLGGGESGNLTDKNKYGYTFAYPNNTLIDYVARKGFSLIRLSFKAGRLQPARDGALDPVELARIDKVVQYANTKGLYVLLDPHDYGSLPDADMVGHKIGSAEMPALKLANFWARVAAVYVNQPNVLFGIINEPFGINARTWQSSAISAVSAIRSVGAKQMIFIPGVSWTGAHSWVSSGNAAVWANFHESNSVFEIHQYFDSDSSGTNETCSSNVGVRRFSGFTAWAEANSQRGFLGEVGWGANSVCETEAEAAFTHMDEHSKAYLGWSYFGAGWYNGFMTLNPTDLGKTTEIDKPQTKLILEHL